jgi:hypothetical protein
MSSKPTWTILQNEPDKSLRHDDFVQAGDMRMIELSVVVDFPCKIRIIFIRRFEDNLDLASSSPSIHLRPRIDSHTLEPFVSL